MASSEIPSITVEVRSRLGSRYAARLRKEGRMPLVIYGHKQEPIHISADGNEMIELLRRDTHVLNVDYDSKSESCLVKDIQWDFLGAHIVHVDLARVDLTETVRTTVLLELSGEPVGLKEPGAMLEHPYSEIEVECQAGNIPDRIRVDISEVDLNAPLTVSDLDLPEGVKTTLDSEVVLASISILAEEEEPEEAVEAGEAEPEVIGGKKEEDGEAAAAE